MIKNPNDPLNINPSSVSDNGPFGSSKAAQTLRDQLIRSGQGGSFGDSITPDSEEQREEEEDDRQEIEQFFEEADFLDDDDDDDDFGDDEGEDYSAPEPLSPHELRVLHHQKIEEATKIMAEVGSVSAQDLKDMAHSLRIDPAKLEAKIKLETPNFKVTSNLDLNAGMTKIIEGVWGPCQNIAGPSTNIPVVGNPLKPVANEVNFGGPEKSFSSKNAFAMAAQGPSAAPIPSTPAPNFNQNLTAPQPSFIKT